MQLMGRFQSLSVTFARRDGIFKERETDMFRHKLLARDRSPTHAEASWQCMVSFPLCGLESVAQSLAARPGLPVHVLFGDHDRVVPFEHNFSKWKAILSAGQCRPTFTVMPDAGHVVLLEYPHESVAIVSDYLDSLRS